MSILASNVGPRLEDVPSRFWSVPQPAARERHWMHPGLAFALVSLTFGLYAFYWLFNTWRQIKAHDGDEGKNALGHTLAMCVPIYGLFRMHAHMRTIVELVRSFGGRTTLSPGTCVLLWIGAQVIERAGSLPNLGLLLVVGALLQATLVAWGQAAINQAWSLDQPDAVVLRTHAATWLVLAVGAVATGLSLVGMTS